MAGIAFLNLSALWAIASGVAVLLLGLSSLRGGRTRPRGALPFGLFAVAWGVQVSAINAARTVGTWETANLLYLTALIGLFFLPYFIVEFAASRSTARGRTVRWQVLRGLTAGLALLNAAVFVFRPELLIEEVSAYLGAAYYPSWGAWFGPFVSIPVFAAFGIAILGLWNAFRRSPTDRTERVELYLLGGLGLYLSYTAGHHLPDYAHRATSPGFSGTAIYFAYAALFALLAAIVLYIGIHHARRWRGGAKLRTSDKWLALAFLVPFLVGLATQTLVIMGATALNLVGFWRLLGVGVITYGLARRRLYDLPQRTRRVGANATGSASALAAGGTAFGAATALSGGLALPLLAGAAVTGATAMPALKWARRLFGTSEGDNPVDEAEQLYEQKIETYRAALEDAMARDSLEEDELFLEGLREDFGIGEAEDRVLRYFARKATVPRREGDPDTAYERLRILGEGGAGRTWLARDRSRDRLVVLKEPLERWHTEPAVLEAARREAKLAAKVRHPNVVEVEQVLEDDGRPVLVMEYVAGGSLADRLRQEGTLDPRETVRIGYDLAQGLEAIHDAGIVHRDLTPDNVLATGDGRAMIADFGLARSTDSSSTQLLGDEAGTRGYRAPEAARGSDEPTVDVYGLAAILHTCLYGSPPIEGTIQVDTEVPRDLQAVVEKGLSVAPENRFDDAEAFAEALEELVER